MSIYSESIEQTSENKHFENFFNEIHPSYARDGCCMYLSHETSKMLTVINTFLLFKDLSYKQEIKY